MTLSDEEVKLSHNRGSNIAKMNVSIWCISLITNYL